MSDDKIQGSGSNADPAPVHRDVLPCPFCGAASVELDSEDYRWVRINCIECGASSPSVRRFQLDRQCNIVVGEHDMYERALAEWNRRDGDQCRDGCKIKRAVQQFNESATDDFQIR